MTVEDRLRNSIIDKLLTISNKEYLSALYQLITTSKVDQDIIQLSEEQIAMQTMSDEDIAHGRLVSQDELDEMDREWLRKL